MPLQEFRQIDSIKLVADIMSRQLARSQLSSKCTLGHHILESWVPGSLHSRVTIIIAVGPLASSLLLDRIPRWLISGSQMSSTDTMDSLAGIRSIPTGIALLVHLLSGIDRSICLQLLVSTGVYTPVTISADMRR